MRETLAKEYLKLNELWSNTDKNTISDNVKKYICRDMPEKKKTLKAVIENIIEITGVKGDTAYAWFNRSRINVKIPLIQLCKIADKMNIEVVNFFKK